jgi:GTP1/Obg family GTP-binding protein
MKYLIIAICLIACNSVKQVLKDPAKVDIVGREWEKDNPCNNDTITVSNSDTTILLDTLYNIYTDTVIVEGKTTTIIKQVPKIVTKTIKIRDTVNNYVVDNRRLNIALDSVNWYKGLTQQFKAKFEQQITETKEQRARANKWRFYFILLCVATALSHYLRSKFL